MRILHSYCLNHNVGDYYLGIGVKNLLRKFLPVELIAENNLQGTKYDRYYITEVINKKYDLLVIGGGGIIHGAHWPNGWFWLIEQELIKHINIPFIIYGVGYNYFEDEDGIPEVGISHLKETILRSCFFSVRNDGSESRFKNSVNVDIDVVPDPGFHINLDRNYICSETEPYVILQLAYDKPDHRLGGAANIGDFVREIREVCLSLSKTYKVVLAPHVYEDIKLSEEVIEGVPNAYIWDFHKYAFDRCEESIGYYQDAHFVIAMRGHGQIIPFAFNTPVIALQNHPKHLGLMQNLGLEDYSIRCDSENLSTKILGLIENLEDNYTSYVSSLKSSNNRLWKETNNAFNRIRKILDILC